MSGILLRVEQWVSETRCCCRFRLEEKCSQQEVLGQATSFRMSVTQLPPSPIKERQRGWLGSWLVKHAEHVSMPMFVLRAIGHELKNSPQTISGTPKPMAGALPLHTQKGGTRRKREHGNGLKKYNCARLESLLQTHVFLFYWLNPYVSPPTVLKMQLGTTEKLAPNSFPQSAKTTCWIPTHKKATFLNDLEEKKCFTHLHFVNYAFHGSPATTGQSG